uniref:Uncharacterized protein n=1 Tax=Strigops habroptila TaxID=2489341 RepID=A0A672UQE6_STRHB
KMLTPVDSENKAGADVKISQLHAFFSFSHVKMRPLAQCGSQFRLQMPSSCEGIWLYGSDSSQLTLYCKLISTCSPGNDRHEKILVYWCVVKLN